MHFPLTLQREPQMGARPSPPDPGERRQVGRYSVEARLCSCCKNPKVRYFVRNIPRTEGIDGDGLLAGGAHWSRLCHTIGWYPLDGLDRDDAIPREGAPPKPKRAESWLRGQLQDAPEPLPVEAYDSDDTGQGRLF